MLNLTLSLRTAALGLLLFFLGSFSVGFATEYITADGNWWRQSVPDEARTYIIAAMLDAYRSGWADGALDSGGRIVDELDGKLTQGNMVTVLSVVYRKNASGSYVELTREPQFSQTFGYYSEALSNFYVAHRTKSSTLIGDILTCLSDNLVSKPDDICKNMIGP